MSIGLGLLATETAGDFYQFARLQAMSEWWHWLVLLTVCAALLAVVVFLYRRDSVELPRGVRWTLLALRVLALLGILFYFFNLEKRTERKIVKNSRVLLLVDTSQSMMSDDETPGGQPPASRIQSVVQELAQGALLVTLRQQHDVVVYRFDQQSKPAEVAALPKLAPPGADAPTVSAEEAFHESVAEARTVALVGGGCLFLSIFFGLVYLIVVRPGSSAESTPWSLLAGVVFCIVALVVFAVAGLRNPQVAFLTMLGLQEGRFTETQVNPPVSEAIPPGAVPRVEQIDWAEKLAARGLETRLGEALRYVVQKERGGPVAGIVVFSDGRSNAGLSCSEAAALARTAEMPIYTVGLGSDKRPLNVRVVDLETPERVYPGDKFTLTGNLQGTGFSSRTLEVRLTSAPAGTKQPTVETLEQEVRVELKHEGEIVPVKFEVTPTEPGRRTYKLSVKPLPGDADPRDDFKVANVEVVERKTRVLLLAGGPAREYAFLRNLLFRDRDMTVDVWLQTGKQGMSQESNKLLFDFPETTQELFEYDCIVAFDPDWTALDLVQVKNLEQWVADKAGGLIVVAGPVHTPLWSAARRGDTRLDTIRNLYPVILYSSGSATLGVGRFGGDNAWPLQFTRDGLEAEFLWLEDNAVSSEAAWAAFAGVYGYYAVKDPKPGARVYACFSDPHTAIDSQLPIYLASHFYGAGRVFFQASGEMWRIRSVEEAYFERYYTKLIRWVSQGRLQQDSTHGVLLVDKERALLGDTVGVRAILTDDQNQPLSVPEVTANLLRPDGGLAPLTLRSVKGGPRDGTYAGQFTAIQEGDYRVELRPPHGQLDELLVREVRVRVPALETEKSERNDPLLAEIAQTTGGAYYVGLAAATRLAGGSPLASTLQAQDDVTYLPGTPDRSFERRLMAWLLAVICGFLCLEWLVRRLSKLA